MKLWWSKSVENVASVERVLAVWLVPIAVIFALGAAQALWRRLHSRKPQPGVSTGQDGKHVDVSHGGSQHIPRQAPHEFSLATSQLDTGGTLLAPARFSLASASLQLQGVSGWMHMILVLLAYWLVSQALQAWRRGGSLLDRAWHATFFDVGPMFSAWAVQLVVWACTTYGYQAAVVRDLLPRRWEVPLQAILELATFAVPIAFMGTRTDWPLLQRIAFGMETAVFVFKQHSYITTNRILREEVERGGPGTGYWVHKLHRRGSPASESAPTSTASVSASYSHLLSQSRSEVSAPRDSHRHDQTASGYIKPDTTSSPRPGRLLPMDGRQSSSQLEPPRHAAVASPDGDYEGTLEDGPFPSDAMIDAPATTTSGTTSSGSVSSGMSLGSLRLRRRALPLQPLAADAIAAAASLDGSETAPPTGTLTDSPPPPQPAAQVGAASESSGRVDESLRPAAESDHDAVVTNSRKRTAASARGSGGRATRGGMTAAFASCVRWLKNRLLEDTVRAGGLLRGHVSASEKIRRTEAAAAVAVGAPEPEPPHGSALAQSRSLSSATGPVTTTGGRAITPSPSNGGSMSLRSSLPGELPSPGAAAADVDAALPVSPCTPWPTRGDGAGEGISGEEDAAEETLRRDPDFAAAAAMAAASGLPVDRHRVAGSDHHDGVRPRGDSSAAAVPSQPHVKEHHGASVLEHHHDAAAVIRRATSGVSGVIHSVMGGVQVDTKVVAYPNNVTFSDFAYFVLAPVLVYEPNYPRVRGPIRPLYVLEKLILALGTIAVANFLVATTFVPVGECMGRMDPFEAVLQLAAPSMLVVLCLFFIVFECVLNGVAECTRFGDRRFYDDWWASTSFSEFSRRWNRPVHEFFLRHAYLDGMRRWGLRPAKALAATFLISIVMHEAIIFAALEQPPPWLALMSLIQFPLMGLMRAPWIKGKVLGNLTFHAFLAVGLGIVITLYGRHYCSLDPAHCDFGGASQRVCA